MNTLDQSRPGTIEHFLTERYALYTTGPGGKLIVVTSITYPGPSS